MSEAQHRRLAELNRGRFDPRFPEASWQEDVDADHALRVLEGEVIERERSMIAARAQAAPTDPDSFVAWFEALEASGPGQHDPLFPWIAETATGEQMRWFLRQEVAGEAGFEDLVALAQLRLPEQPKLELARNYWDEMGRGNAGGMHGPMLARLATAVDLASLEETVPVVWESLALGNIMLGLAANRRYAYHALGALGAIELTAPGRAALVNQGLKRLKIAGHARHYFALHATLDIKHSAAWNEEVLHPVVAAEPRAAIAIAEGALLRLEAGRRCFERYRAELGLDQSQPSRVSSASRVVRSAVPMSLR
ncbi:MAG: iron-containing redox enzyme family protein [Deltaproteobacteria bacterium]|nr:iron-containing redox enzyme family protein [Deltaproteobacteria bacterium]MDQ3299872.1 iron-containing redox enzyme family protein [Myxococcota bacterium]